MAPTIRLQKKCWKLYKLRKLWHQWFLESLSHQKQKYARLYTDDTILYSWADFCSLPLKIFQQNKLNTLKVAKILT